MVDNLRWTELLPSMATDLSPFIKGLGKFQDSPGLYGVGTGIAGLEGMNHIIKEARAAHAIWMRPDQEHVKPSLTRLAFGVLNVAGYGLYGAGAGGYLGRYGTGGGLLLVTAANVMKQHFLPVEQRYRPDEPVLPLHRGDIATNVSPVVGHGDTPGQGNIARYAQALLPAPSVAAGPLVARSAKEASDDRWLQAGVMETGTVRPAPSGPGTPVTGATVGWTPDIVHPVAVTTGADLRTPGRSGSLPDLGTAPPAAPAARGGAHTVASARSDGARPRTR